ncbi:MAG: alanine--tRNA ligase, partial [Candidatus Paceibacterota bacterium]
MYSTEIREKFLNFFKEREHVIIPSASLVPENDPSVLFTTAGMQPLAPFLLGEEHPEGKRLVNVQKCVRTNDIEEVGDATHLTFFEMLGNWSLGDYFKEEAIQWSYELLTSKEKGFGLDPERLFISVFEGDENAPVDEEAREAWKKVGIKESRIYLRPASENWWSPGDNGPCGPDSEMFYDVTEKGLGDMTPEEFEEADERGDVVEIWNDVFMQYEKKNGEVIGELKNKNVDTGAGLERLAAVLQGKNSVFETDLFENALKTIKKYDPNIETRARNIMADHIRAVTFMIADGAEPSNTDRGYVVRRLIRRAYRMASKNIEEESASELILELSGSFIKSYQNIYPELVSNSERIEKVLSAEVEKFQKTLKEGLKKFEKIANKDISGEDAFLLFSTYGFPIDMTIDLAFERGLKVDTEAFQKAYEEHQKRSRSSGGG